MSRSLSALSVGVLLLPSLLAPTPIHAQEVAGKIEPPHSIISLAEAARPQGQLLARNVKDAKFERVPANYHVFQAANSGEDTGTETLRLNFDGDTRLTKIESKNKDFVVEPGGTCHEGNSYSHGDSCSLVVRFNPQGPGHRSGSLNVFNSAEAKPMFVGLAGNGYAPVISFTPSQISTVSATISGSAGTINSATNLAVDGGDTLYIADIGNKIIKELDSSGTFNTVSPVFATPATLVADSSGFLYSLNVTGSTYYFSYYAPWGSQSAYGTTYAAGNCTPSTPCSLTSVGMSRPANINIDPYDNLFFEEATKGAAEMPVATVAGGSGGALNLWYLKNQFTYTSGTPASFAVDGNDNIYNFYNYSTGTCYIQQDPLYNAETTPIAKKVVGGSACGFSGDNGQARSAEISKSIGQMTFDVAGNLYFVDAGNLRVRRVDAASGIISTIAGNGTAGSYGDAGSATGAALSNPSGLAVDSQGQVYILSSFPTAAATQVVRKIGTLGFWNFGTQLITTSNSLKVFTVANTGNTALTLSSNAFFTGNTADFTLDATSTNCVLTAGATLAAGHSCNIGIKFTPTAVGNRAAYLVLTSNTLTGSNRISVNGAGTLPSPTMTITSPASGATGKTGTPVTFAVSVTSTTSVKPTGTVQFKVNGANLGTPVALSASGTASTSVTESTAATYTLSATYSGDANYSTVTVSQNLVVSAVAKVVPKVTLSPRVVGLSSCNSAVYAVRVSSTSGGIPTGTVELKSGDSLVATATLVNGAASLSAGSLGAGSHTIVATYVGDSQNAPAQSAPLSVKSSVTTPRTCGVGVRPIRVIQ